MKKVISIILCFILVLSSTSSYAAIIIEPQAEPDGYVVVYSVKRTKVVTEAEATLSAVSNFVVLTAFSYGLGYLANLGFGLVTITGVESLHAGESVTTFTTITYDKFGKEFDYVQRTTIKRGSTLVKDYTFIESFSEGSQVYNGWWNEFKNIISQGGL